MQSTQVAGFHFSSCKVIQKGPNLLNGVCLALVVTSGQQTEKGISLTKKTQIIETGRNSCFITANSVMNSDLPNTAYTAKFTDKTVLA